MTENRKPRRRRRWIIPLVAIGAGAWYVRSRRAAPDPWHPALPAAATDAAGGYFEAAELTAVGAAPVGVRTSAPDPDVVVEPVPPRHAASTPESATLDVPVSDHPRHSAATPAPPATASDAEQPGPAVMPAAPLPEPTPLTGPAPDEPPVAKAAKPASGSSAAATSAPSVAQRATPPPGVSTSGALTSGTPNALFTPTAPTPGQGTQPLPDGSAPSPEYTIKGNADSMLFHTPASPYYKRTRAEVWFRTAEDAAAAGFTEWVPKKRST